MQFLEVAGANTVPPMRNPRLSYELGTEASPDEVLTPLLPTAKIGKKSRFFHVNKSI